MPAAYFLPNLNMVISLESEKKFSNILPQAQKKCVVARTFRGINPPSFGLDVTYNPIPHHGSLAFCANWPAATLLQFSNITKSISTEKGWLETLT